MSLQSMKQGVAFTVSSAATVKLLTQLALTDKQLNELAGCDVSVQNNDIFIRTDGSELTSFSGMLIKAGTIFRLTPRSDVLNCVMIASGTSALIVPTALRGE